MRANENNEKMTRATSIHHVDFITRGVLQEAHIDTILLIFDLRDL